MATQKSARVQRQQKQKQQKQQKSSSQMATKTPSIAEMQAGGMSSADILAMQRLTGNRSVQRTLLARKEQQEEVPNSVKQSNAQNRFESIYEVIAHMLREQIEKSSEETKVDAEFIAAMFAWQAEDLDILAKFEEMEETVTIRDAAEGEDLEVSMWEWLTKDGAGKPVFEEAGLDDEALLALLKAGNVELPEDWDLEEFNEGIEELFEEEIEPMAIAEKARYIRNLWGSADVPVADSPAVWATVYLRNAMNPDEIDPNISADSDGKDIAKMMSQMEKILELDA